MSPERLAYVLAAMVVVGSVGAAIWMVGERIADRSTVIGSGTALVGGPFTLTAHTGERVSDAGFRGRLMLVYFGYTYCPDVCPTELQVMGQAIDLLGEEADEVAPIFITVDPERDTREVMAAYVPFFHDRLIGLTGTPQEIAEVAKAYRIYYATVEGGEGGVYLMDHTSLVYLMGRDGRYLRHFTHGTEPRAMADAIAEAL